MKKKKLNNRLPFDNNNTTGRKKENDLLVKTRIIDKDQLDSSNIQISMDNYNCLWANWDMD